MNLKSANELGMKWVDSAGVSELTKDQMYSSVAWFLFKMDKEGYEMVEKSPALKLGDTVSKEELGKMLSDGVIY